MWCNVYSKGLYNRKEKDMIDKDMKLAKLYVGRIKGGKRVKLAFGRIIMRCIQSEADVKQLRIVISNERIIRGDMKGPLKKPNKKKNIRP